MKPFSFTLILGVLFSFSIVSAQNEANIWYFGLKAGIDFNTSPPIPLLNGALSTREGCATVCDQQGNLLFYTEGDSVWNANHQVMPNGTGLGGHISSTQSSVAIAWPDSAHLYYIFTLDEQAGTNGLRYSVVNMNRQNGLGDITLKNIQLYTPSCEKLTAVKHANGQDIWVITHAWNSAEFHTYLVTSQGIQPTPYIQSIGIAHTGSPANTVGYMKSSSNGDKIASAMYNLGSVQVFDFDNATGLLSNPITLNTNIRHAYGVEFSLNSRFLYASYFDTALLNNNYIYQYDLSLAGATQITQNAIIIKHLQIPISTGDLRFGALQMTPDQRIFIARTTGNFVSSIEFPDSLGLACGYQDTSMNLLGRAPMFGLPNFNSSHFQRRSLVLSDGCVNRLSSFTLTDTSDIDSIKWDFGDSQAGGNDTSSLFFAGYTYSSAGNYTIQAVYYINGTPFPLSETISIYPIPEVSLPGDTSLCFLNTDSLSISAQSLQQNFLWSTGEMTSDIKVKGYGWFWVEVSNFCGVHRDSMRISEEVNLSLALPPELQICENDSFFMDVNLGNGIQYRWHDGLRSGSRYIKDAGWNWLEASNSCGSTRDSIWVIIDPLPSVDLGNDTSFCDGESIIVDASFPGATYRWQDGSRQPGYLISSTGTYEVRVSNHCGLVSDAIAVFVDQGPEINLGEDTTLCLDEVLLLEAYYPQSKYLWQDGSTKPYFRIEKPGMYMVMLSHPCGSAQDSIEVDFEHCDCTLYMANAFSPNGDGHNDVFHPVYSCPIDNYLFQIYNRWGILIFETKDPTQYWDGLFKSEQVPEGVYVWHISYQSPIFSHSLIEKTGSVTVIR